MDEMEILKGLANAVVQGDSDASKKYANEAVSSGVDAYNAINNGCAQGMAIISKKYDDGEVYVPDILVASQAMYDAITILKPHIKTEATSKPGKIVLGVVEGDVHDIGKNIVKIMLDAAGFNVIDLGRDVRLKQFIETVKSENPDMLGLSALMTMSMMAIPETITMLKDAGIREKVKVIIGGAPVSAMFAEKVGADGYGQNAPDAVKLAKKIMQEKG